MRYYVAPGAAGGASSWADAGDLERTLNRIINNPSPDGDEIWAAGEQNVLGYQGPYDLSGVPLSIIHNVAPLSIYGGFAGWENLLCERDATINPQHYPTFFQHPSILDGGNMVTIIEMQSAGVCRIDGFIISNGKTMGGSLLGGGVDIRSSYNLWFENIVFMDNEAAYYGGGMLAEGVSNLMIKNTIFVGNKAESKGGGLFVMDGDNTLLVNLLFNNNQTMVGESNAIFMENSINSKIINNTITGNIGSTANSSSVFFDPRSGGNIYNSIFYPDTLMVTGPNIVIDYCLLNQPILPSPSNNQFGINPPANPLFINPNPIFAGGDYHLQSTSQCIDRGNTNFIFPLSATDLEGNPRFINKGQGTNVIIQVDMGAFEVQ